MQVILLDKVVNLGVLGEIVKVKDGYARNFLIPVGPRPPRHRSQQGRIRSQARRTRKGCGRQAGRIASPGRKARRHDRQADAKGRRRRPSVRLGHQPRHRRRAQQARLQGREVASAHAQRSDQDRRRQHRQRGAAHRRGGRHHRHGVRRNRLITAARLVRVSKAAFGRLLFFWPAELSRALHRKITAYSQPCPVTPRAARLSMQGCKELHVRRFFLRRQRPVGRPPDRAAAHSAAFDRGRIERARAACCSTTAPGTAWATWWSTATSTAMSTS